MDAAVVELDPLPDPVRAAADDDDLGLVGEADFVFEQDREQFRVFRFVRRVAAYVANRHLVGRVEIRSGSLELGGTGVDKLVYRSDPDALTEPADLHRRRAP